MKKSNSFYFKLFASAIFLAAVVAMFVYVNVKGDINHNILSFSCAAACFVLSLLFIRLTAKKILLTLALGVNLVADSFFVLSPNTVSTLVGLCVVCGVQFCFFVYTLTLSKGIGLKIVNIALRVALCLLAYFLLPKYITIGKLEMIAIMYALNCVVTLFVLLFHLKKNFVLFLGLLLLLVSHIFVGLANGGAELLKAGADFIKFLSQHNLAFMLYIPSLLLISFSSVWERQ